ncbi:MULTISPECIES: hypothetical protein [Roseobacteraceae]|uniref:Uncharacterized protein n=2 Tax=Roseobacteraceae TaxID=2854170 RepID=K2J099_9RHOB|nr:MULTISPECIES: hypothetical protein [Roseobacteraceae]EKE68207.1 hypothetical protein B30_18907 [Celeribacter baekdonensis B30]MCV2890413.1 hypothetical protein [Ruegeria sp. XHP0148]
MQNRRWDILIAAVVVTLFGLLTVLSGGRALFGGLEARAAVGDAVPFVLWFNFLAGFAYVAAGIGLILQTNWATKLSIAILVATVLVMIAFGVHVLLGGAYEMRTVWAMSLRTVVWGVVVGLVIRNPDGSTPEPLDERP